MARKLGNFKPCGIVAKFHAKIIYLLREYVFTYISLLAQNYHSEIEGDARILRNPEIVNPYGCTSMFTSLRSALPYRLA